MKKRKEKKVEKKRTDYLAIAVIIMILIASFTGVLQLNFSNGQGGITHLFSIGFTSRYFDDYYYKRVVSVSMQCCIFFVFVPMFIYTYIKYLRSQDNINRLRMISLYAVTMYYARVALYEVADNDGLLNIIYIALFICSIIAIFEHFEQGSEGEIEGVAYLAEFLIIAGIVLIGEWLPNVMSGIAKHGDLEQAAIYASDNSYIINLKVLSIICIFNGFCILKNRGPLTILTTAAIKILMIIGAMTVFKVICIKSVFGSVPLNIFVKMHLPFVVVGVLACYFDYKIYKGFIDKIKLDEQEKQNRRIRSEKLRELARKK